MVSVSLWGVFAVFFIAFAGWGEGWMWGWLWAACSLFVGYLFGLIPRALRLQDNNGMLEAIMPWRTFRMPIRDIVRIRRGAGVGPYGEIWIEGKDDKGNDTNEMRLSMTNFGYAGMQELLLDLVAKNPKIEFDGYAKKIMGMNIMKK